MEKRHKNIVRMYVPVPDESATRQKVADYLEEIQREAIIMQLYSQRNTDQINKIIDKQIKRITI